MHVNVNYILVNILNNSIYIILNYKLPTFIMHFTVYAECQYVPGDPTTYKLNSVGLMAI